MFFIEVLNNVDCINDAVDVVTEHVNYDGSTHEDLLFQKSEAKWQSCLATPRTTSESLSGLSPTSALPEVLLHFRSN